MKNNVAKLTAGMKRTVTKVIQEWSVTCEEGKSPIAFPIFKRLCQSMAASGSAEHVYAKFWLNLEWSMIIKTRQLCKLPCESTAMA